MRVQTEEWRRFIPGVRMYKGKLTYFYNGEKLWDADTREWLIYNQEEMQKWKVIIVLPGVEIIPEWTFLCCENVETVIMSDSVQRIEYMAFCDCKSLKFVRLSKNLEYIGRRAFSCCTSLTSIFIPESCRETGKQAFAGCQKLMILSVPRHTTLGEQVIQRTALFEASPFETDEWGEYSNWEEVNEWIKKQHNNYPLHQLCCGEHPSSDLDLYNDSDWFQKDDVGLTPIDYFIANFGEAESSHYLPQYVQHLIKNDKLKEMSRDEMLVGQLKWQQDEIDSLKKDRDHIMSVTLLEDEIKCCLCYNKFSTDLNSTLPEIRKFLPVLSRAKCPHYFCQGCVEQSQLAAAENEPRNIVPKWLKCLICKQKTAFCPQDPFYHTKLIELLERARRCHSIDVKVEEVQEAAVASSNSNENRLPKRAKVAIKEEN